MWFLAFKKNVMKYIPICESVTFWLDSVGQEARSGVRACEGSLGEPGWEKWRGERRHELGEGTSLLPESVPAPCDCCLGDGWGLSGMLGDRIHLLDS